MSKVALTSGRCEGITTRGGGGGGGHEMEVWCNGCTSSRNTSCVHRTTFQRPNAFWCRYTARTPQPIHFLFCQVSACKIVITAVGCQPLKTYLVVEWLFVLPNAFKSLFLGWGENGVENRSFRNVLYNAMFIENSHANHEELSVYCNIVWVVDFFRNAWRWAIKLCDASSFPLSVANWDSHETSKPTFYVKSRTNIWHKPCWLNVRKILFHRHRSTSPLFRVRLQNNTCNGETLECNEGMYISLR